MAKIRPKDGVALPVQETPAAEDAVRRDWIEANIAGGSGPHAILSATHTDTDETKAPVGGDLFKFVGGLWVPGRVVWGEVQDKPATFPPDDHGHDLATTTVAGFSERSFSGADKATLDVLGQITRAERVTDTPVDTNSWTTMTWDSEVQDEIGCFDSAAPARMTPPAGKYLGTATTVWNSNSNGIRAVRIYHFDSAGTLKKDYSASTVGASIDQFGRNEVSSVNITIVAGDYLAVDVFQSSGVRLNFGKGTVTSLPTPYFQLMRVR